MQPGRPSQLIESERTRHECNDVAADLLPSLGRDLAAHVVTRDAKLRELSSAHDPELAFGQLGEPVDESKSAGTSCHLASMRGFPVRESDVPRGLGTTLRPRW